MKAEKEALLQESTGSFPFSDISILKIIAAAICGSVIAFLATQAIENGFSMSNAFHSTLSSAIVQSIVLLNILLQFRKQPHLWNKSFSSPTNNRTWRLLWLVLPLIMFSIGSIWLWYFTLQEMAPGFLDSLWQWIEEEPLYNPGGSLGSITLYFLTVVIFAPIIEEILFRGVIFDKLSQRWGPITGVIGSSILFGILHPTDPIGAFLFGVILCLLYLHTQSLLIPIACHMTNNLLVFLLALWFPNSLSLFETQEQLYSQAWIGIILLITGSIWLGRFACYHSASLRKPTLQE